jgi:signal transduction histidine kinase
MLRTSQGNANLLGDTVAHMGLESSDGRAAARRPRRPGARSLGDVRVAGCGGRGASASLRIWPLGRHPVRWRRLGRTPAAAFRQTIGWRALLVAGLALTCAVGFLHPAYHDMPTLRSACEAAIAVLAAVAAWWIGVEFVHTRRLRTLLVLAALLVLAEVEFFGELLPVTVHLGSADHLAALLPTGRLLAALTLAAAALTPSHRLTISTHRPLTDVAFFSLAVTGLAEAGGLALRHHLLPPAAPHAPVLSTTLEDPLRLVVALATPALFAFSAAKLAQAGRLEARPPLGLLGGAALVFATSCLYYLPLTRTSPTALTLSEILRLLAFGMLCAAAARADRQVRREITRAAALAERSRVAQDLHDGLAQDLAVIAAHGARLGAELGHQHPVAVAARRALTLSRGAILELSDSSAATSGEALQALAAELHERFRISIAVDVQPEAEPDLQERDNVTRITREAIANAARHGRARNVLVSLKRTPAGVALRIRDDGCGLAGAATTCAGEGFGLSHMRERAALLGGSFVVRTPKSGGTELEITFP